MKTINKILYALLPLLFFVVDVSGQIYTCPSCIGPGYGCAEPVSSADVSTIVCPSGLPYVLVYDDEFTGNAIDLSKWQTCSMTNNLDRYQSHGGWYNTKDYDNGENFIFNNPGVTLFEESVTPFSALAVEYELSTTPQPNGTENLQTWYFTSSSLYSGYTFPSDGQNEGLNGIYVLTCTLPVVPNPYASSSYPNPYGSFDNHGNIWPAFWMQGNDTNYGEFDGFEFAQSNYEDLQTSWSSVGRFGTLVDCHLDYYDGTNFGDGTSRTFTMIYTPNEHDWCIGNNVTRQDTRYYYELGGDPWVLNQDACNNEPSGYVTGYGQQTAFPTSHLQLHVSNGVQSAANANYFPVHFDIQSVKYYEPLPCSGTVNVDTSEVKNLYVNKYNTYNVVAGGTVILTCATKYDATIGGYVAGFKIPLYKHPDSSSFLGQLKLIGANSVVIKGGFATSGYFVAKTDNNLCNEYPSGAPLPSPYEEGGHRKINKGSADSSNGKNKDSINCYIKQSLTKGEFSIGVNNISHNELGQLANISVYNMLGQTIFTGALLIEENNEIPINLSIYAKGVYLVIIRTNTEILHEKVILQ